MSTPKVFEVVFKTEVEAADFESAVREGIKRIGSKPFNGVTIKHGVIRDDDLIGDKDIISRHTNHVAVLEPKERQELESIISALASTSVTMTSEERTKLLNKATNLLAWHGG